MATTTGVDASSSSSTSSPPPHHNPPVVWHWRNYGPAKPFSPVNRAVTVHVPPDTDIWRPSPDRHNFTAPFLYTALPRDKFQSVQVTVSAPWKTLYDQGGLVLSFPPRGGGDVNATRFIKAGIEFTDGAPALGVVGTDVLSDWSLSPILAAATTAAAAEETQDDDDDLRATILVERDGTDAWVYVLEEDGPGGKTEKKKRRALRQLTWAFGEGNDAPEIEVGIYGAKPTRESGPGREKDTIPVSFSGFALNTVDGPVH